MNVGIVWPTPGTSEEPLPEDRLHLVKSVTKATHLRLNLHHLKPGIERMIQTARSTGFQVLPILDFTYTAPDQTAYAAFCAEAVTKYGFSAVELGNEPKILHNMSPNDYAAVVAAGARAIRETGISAQIYIAGEITIPICKKIDYFSRVRKLLSSDLYDVVAIHPYRNPKPPEFTKMKTRLNELRYYQSQIPDGKGVAVTEVGWDLRDGVTEQVQADYIFEELAIWQRLGVDAVYIYQHTDPPTNKGFGVFDHTWSPRPAAHAISRFQAENLKGAET